LKGGAVTSYLFLKKKPAETVLRRVRYV
jgi:hypothetical protein